ncbi:helix-turn-helix transcriptional regulator [Paramicrobacterium agarici]|uniref:helix-turn-helix transcriptional regulator n=1 Tax=Paramicrobacterium agarici TaxID=630514 RepID=UPI00114EDF15|nr:helix-turn-helix transcriptional regulator [Microbacterium agarici]TQO23320.1 helix-turn-helix protein [Microbacterium agarici]
MVSEQRAQLADFLRTRRAALQPEDVGMPRGARRRTDGLRREEVAALAGLSADYYTRMEQQRGPNPSEQMLAALARGLRLSLDERDHLLRLGGYPVPRRVVSSDHVDAGIMRILDRLADTPAMVVGSAGEILIQTGPATALFGDESRFEGLGRSVVYRWFTDPDSRSVYPEEDHDERARDFVADLRTAYVRDSRPSPVAEIVDALTASSAEFRALWAEHRVGRKHSQYKRLVHAEVGLIEVYCQSLYDLDQSQGLLVFTAVPGSESAEKLRLLSVLDGRAV